MRMKLSGMVRMILLALFLAVTLSGCSLFEKKQEQAVATEAEKRDIAVAERGSPSRELGSLWSDSSKWNDFYGAPTGRNVGDMVILKPSDSFKSTLTSQLGKNAPTDNAAYENARIIATVKEVLPRQVYRVEANQALRLGKSDVQLHYKGKIRDQDVGADDSSTTDSVFDGQLQVEAKNTEAPPAVASAGNTSEPTKDAKETSATDSEKKQ